MAGTVETHNGVKYFEFQKVMITKTTQGWRTLTGEKFDGRKIAGFLKRGNVNCRLEVAHIKSVCNRFFGGEYAIEEC